MFRLRSKSEKNSAEDKAIMHALRNTQALIWFDLNGKILDANENYLALTGYRKDELVGQNQQVLLSADAESAAADRQIWEKLRKGETVTGNFARQTNNGREIWMAGSYSPVLGPDNQPNMVIQVATDISALQAHSAETERLLAAVSGSQAVIEFAPDGTIRTANELFMTTMGYSLADIVGKHHRTLMPKDLLGAQYDAFWEDLRSGKDQDGVFPRIDQSGNTIWLQATYCPIPGPDGQVCKVVKFARDITQDRLLSMDARGQLAAISRSQAVIEFSMDGTILKANDNFCSTLGYEPAEILGKHHSMFVRKEETDSASYQEFWETLRSGTFRAAEYCRVGKGGKEIWIQASYNPIFDETGKPVKVVKYATDVTPRKLAVEAVRAGLAQLAHGDLSVSLNQTFPIEYEQLREDLNTAAEKLRDTLLDVVSRVHTIQSQSDEISASSEDLSRRTEQQAATLEQTAAAIDEMNSSIKSASDGAEQASDVATTARRNAEASGRVVRDAVAAMDEIAEGSAKISRITSVIEEIAFQTNLLALNAGVEAARAGEAGRGFAVVASEVRALAQRSSEAAREIAELLTASGNQVNHGVALVNQAGEALGGIEKSVIEVQQRVADIATSSQEQSAGLNEINIAVNHLDQVTQQNASMFVQTSNSTTSLTRVADELAASTSVFILGAETHVSREHSQSSQLSELTVLSELQLRAS